MEGNNEKEQKNNFLRYKNTALLLKNGGVSDIYHYEDNEDNECVVFNYYVPASNMIYYNGWSQQGLLNISLTLLSPYHSFHTKEAHCFALSPNYKNKKENGLEKDLDKIVNSSLYNTIQSLPIDIKEKGEQMAEAYLYLYCIENTLRVFIENSAKSSCGENYFSQLNISSKISTEIHNRKTNAERHKWLSIRGDSDLYYLDFKDLGEVIINNWQIFDKSFPHQNWVKSKFDELGNIRNLIAHNSFIGEHEREILRTSFHTILRQINF